MFMLYNCTEGNILYKTSHVSCLLLCEKFEEKKIVLKKEKKSLTDFLNGAETG